MKTVLKNIFYSFPVQLFVLHFRKNQLLLVFWFILYSTIGGNFLKSFGADGLVLAPEYLGRVDFLALFITGLALGVYIMSWNITTFILHSKRFKFLATTSNPFLKYCINNSLLPLAFLTYYLIKLYRYNDFIELRSTSEILTLMSALVLGIAVIWIFSFLYFFGAGKTIVRRMAPLVSDPDAFRKKFNEAQYDYDDLGSKISYFFSSSFRLRKPRNVSHYNREFLEMIFKRYHLAGITSILLAFLFLVMVGFLLEYPLFEMPAAASVLVFCSILIAVIGSLTYFLKSWSLPVAILLLIVVNILYRQGVLDPRNKAYGLNYSEKIERTPYNKQSLQSLCTPQQIESDRQNMMKVLDAWKQRQKSDKPVMVFINVSGGGLRSGAFTMNSLQQIDSRLEGQLMNQAFLIGGASGGMLAAAYYRELYRKKMDGENINLSDSKYLDNICGDLLNPVFSSMIARDIFAPSQSFRVGTQQYVKDRGYAFEKKLSDNTKGVLNVQMKELADDEKHGRVPLMIFNNVIKRDGRRMMICTQPLSFMMKPRMLQQDTAISPDAIDFNRFFKNRQPENLRLLTALRMNATFPYVLPTVWLPTDPVIDVMDAGLRDNYGVETSMRFIENFEDWIKQNTSGVLIVQIRDKLLDNWQFPFETKSLLDMLVNPATILQHNWYKLQDYSQTDQYNYFVSGSGVPVHRVNLLYIPEKEDKIAALNFHISGREKRDVQQSFEHPVNQSALQQIAHILNR